MQFIDTHSHLYARQFHADQAAVTARAREVLSHCFLPNIDLRSVEDMLALTATAPDFFFPMMGLHPCSVKEDWKEVLRETERLLRDGKWHGIGETGLDYHWDKTFVAEQKQALAIQFDWAKELGLPIILHCRESMDDVIEMAAAAQDGRLRGIFHCFTGTVEQAQRITGMGFMLGIGGVITYKNSGLFEIAAQLKLDDLVLETDSPYLTPVPHRGQRNESAYTALVARKLAEAQQVLPTVIAEKTSANALRMFGKA
jgi:TatD DNase family protein